MVEKYEFSIDEVLEVLESQIKKFKTIQEAADYFNVSRSFLWKVRNKESRPTPSMLDKIGVRTERVIEYHYYKEPVN